MDEKVHSPRKYLFWGVVLLLGGVLWRLSLMGWFALSWELTLPGLLIVIGLALILSGFYRRRTSPCSEAPSQEVAKP